MAPAAYGGSFFYAFKNDQNPGYALKTRGKQGAFSFSERFEASSGFENA